MFKTKVNPIKVPSEIQKKYSSKFSPRLSNIALPIVVFVNNIYKLE